MMGRTGRGGLPRPVRQGAPDLRREHAAIDKAGQGVALVIEALDEVPDEYRRAFALCLVLARLSEAARTDMAKAMLQAASGGDMRAAPVPAFMQAAQSPPT